uniref:Uncharacterized protein n=1 Tax=Oryza barthii TaxID=65489 RepID=A0A0D3G6K8_9ORYZ
MSTNRDTLMQESPTMVTRRRLAMLLGDSSGTTGEAGGNLGASSAMALEYGEQQLCYGAGATSCI